MALRPIMAGPCDKRATINAIGPPVPSPRIRTDATGSVTQTLQEISGLFARQSVPVCYELRWLKDHEAGLTETQADRPVGRGSEGGRAP